MPRATTATKTTAKPAAKTSAAAKPAAKASASKATTKTATKTAARPAARKVAVAKTDDGHPIYDAANSRDSYKKGDVLYFGKVRNWLDRGELVEGWGTVVGVGLFDNEVPYLEVKFDDKKLNKSDLGKDIRKYLLEVK